MLLRATHTTTYLYSEPVSICHTEVHLAPRHSSRQRLVEHELLIRPQPAQLHERLDYFGNPVTFFCLSEPHETLTITARSVVEVASDAPLLAGISPPWQEVCDQLRRRDNPDILAACEFTFESPLIQLGPEFAAFATKSFTPGRPLLEAALDLSHRIFTTFTYDQRATTVTTPVREVLKTKQGVCQDFAHFFIACLRSLGLAARYVSGYLRSGPNSIGAEASHAWAAIFCPGCGWFDFDPTNDVMPAGNHVTVAWGRDYSDVTPVKGVALGGGEQVITVAVEVVPENANPVPAAG
ncbi:MAG: transglutaminase N-terminal domain-containing protein [Acidobacteriota bacterium]